MLSDFLNYVKITKIILTPKLVIYKLNQDCNLVKSAKNKYLNLVKHINLYTFSNL